MNNKKLVHGFYLALIGLLVAFLANREIQFHRRMAYQAAVMVPIVQELSKQHRSLTSETEKEYKDYPSPRFQDIFHQTARADSLQKVLVIWLDSLQQTDKDQYRHTALHQYNALARELSLPDVDPALRDQIQNGTTNTAHATLLGLTASALSKSWLERSLVLAQQMSSFPKLDALIPNVEPEQAAVAGQPFRAEIYPVYYSTNYDTTSVPFVNDSIGKFERGQFQFREIADKSGERRYLVRVKDKNPFSSDTILRQKTMKIRVW